MTDTSSMITVTFLWEHDDPRTHVSVSKTFLRDHRNILDDPRCASVRRRVSLTPCVRRWGELGHGERLTMCVYIHG